MQVANSLSTNMPLLASLASPSLASPDSTRLLKVADRRVHADIGLPSAAAWHAEDIGPFAVPIGKGSQSALDKQLGPAKCDVCLILAFGAEQQASLAGVQLLVDSHLESEKHIVEIVVGFGSV